MFISFEGIDGCGKTTQAKLLYNKLKQNKEQVVLTSEPAKNEIGLFIRNLIKNPAQKYDPLTLQLLFMSDRAYHVNKFINPRLKKRYTIITDRYLLSTIAYGSAFGIDRNWLYKMNLVFPYPDLNFIIDIEPKEAIKRIQKKKSGDYFEKLKFMVKIRQSYKNLPKRYKNCFIINGNKSIEETSKEVMDVLRKHIKSKYAPIV